MDQISPPMRIVLAVAVVFLAAYMLFLKPGGDNTTASAPTTPAAATPAPASASASDANHAKTGLGKAVEAAHGAAAATEKSQDKSSTAAGDAATGAANAPSTTQSTPSTTAPTTPSTSETAPAKPADASLAKLPDWLQKSLDHKVVAILFTNGKAADDRRTRDALKHAYRAHGKVVTRSVPIAQISKYRPVAQGVDVDQSPTLMVIDRHRQAQSLVGYSSLEAINQAIIDGLLATDDPVKHVKYLQTVQRECRQIANQAIIGDTEGSSVKGAKKNIDALIATTSSSLGTLKNAPVPAGYKPLSKLVNRYVASEIAVNKKIRSTAIGKRQVDGIKVNKAERGNDKLQNKTTLELTAVGVDACS